MPQIVEKGKSAIGHKIGPLPLWGWVVGGAVAVFAVKKMRGGSSSAAGGSGIPIPTLTPGSGSYAGDSGGAIGSPNQNWRGGMDTQPIGDATPWRATPPAWWR